MQSRRLYNASSVGTNQQQEPHSRILSPEHGYRSIQLDKLRIQVLRVELIDFDGNILVSVEVVAF